MKIVYMGTPEFAVEPLKRLIGDGFEIVGVFTQPDRPRSRGMKISTCPVKDAALEAGITVYQPETLRDGQAAEILNEISPDLLAVVAYGNFLPTSILKIPCFGAINIHASLLPKYRGASPIQQAILSGDEVTGVTSMYLSKGMDEGDIIYSEQTEIREDETSGELSERLSVLGAELLVKTVADIANGTAPRVAQENDKATYAPPLTKDLSPIDWGESAKTVMRKIYGLQPWPTATMEFKSETLKVFGARLGIGRASGKPGEIIDNKAGLEVVCGGGETIIITEVQAAGKRRMHAADFLRGKRSNG